MMSRQDGPPSSMDDAMFECRREKNMRTTGEAGETMTTRKHTSVFFGYDISDVNPIPSYFLATAPKPYPTYPGMHTSTSTMDLPGTGRERVASK